MTVVTRWEPFNGLSNLHRQVNRLLLDDTIAKDSAVAAWSPAVDIHETENELVVKADLPGISENDIDIHVENNLLTVTGERKLDQEVQQESYLRVERTYGAFSRSFSLPNTVNPEGIRAEYSNGVLTLNLPKREESKPRQVKVTVSGAKPDAK